MATVIIHKRKRKNLPAILSITKIHAHQRKNTIRHAVSIKRLKRQLMNYVTSLIVTKCRR